MEADAVVAHAETMAIRQLQEIHRATHPAKLEIEQEKKQLLETLEAEGEEEES